MILSVIVSMLCMSAISSPPSTYEVIEDTCHLPLLNPELKERKTLKLKLSNGLQVLLISDPGADQSAASVSVGCGSWNDPEAYPGMAHFCEHMLFMGTEKYPVVNEFSSLLADYAGQTNAFTAPHRTVYMFSSQTSGFLLLLDRFAHFFIDPLFNPSFLSREMQNVDQEFAKNIESDGWREYMVFKETGNQEHPNKMFATGNSQTLKAIPQEALRAWHQNNYGARRMRLVIYSPLSMEELKKTVFSSFSLVPEGVESSLQTDTLLTSSEQTAHFTYIRPVKDRRSLTLSWELPLEFSKDPSKSMGLIAYALRRGHSSSLYEALKQKHWIDAMSIRLDDIGGKIHQFFQISCELTQKGLEEIDFLILYCFQALKEIQDQGVPSYLFQEKNTMAQLAYQYQSRSNPFDYVMSLAEGISEEPLSSYPRETLLAKEFDADKVIEAAQFLKPQNCLISLLASPETAGFSPDRQEKWLGAEYTIKPFSQEQMSLWTDPSLNDQISIADPNPFVPETLSLVPKGPQVPILLSDSEFGSAYYVRSAEFQVPESVVHLHIFSEEMDASARSDVLVSLYIDHLTDQLLPTLAAAQGAGLSSHFSADLASLHVQVSGFSDKAPLLLRTILSHLSDSPPTPEQFDVYVKRHETAYLNGQKDLAVRQAKELLDSIVNPETTTKKEKLKALRVLSYEDFLQFYRRLFEKTYTKALFAGNLTQKEAESTWLDLLHALGSTPYPKEKHPLKRVLQLKNQKGPYKISQTTEARGNATVLLLDEGSFSHRHRAVQEVLSSLLKEAFFNELRTKQKTGYIAQSDALDFEGKLFQYFLVQSNTHQPEELLFRFELFLEEYEHALEETVSQERFDTIKASLISSLKTRFRNLQTKAYLWDFLAFEKGADFAFVEKRLEALEQLDLQAFLDLSKQILSRSNTKRVAILYEGKLDCSFSYHPIHLLEIQEIASYLPDLEEESL